MSSPRNILPLLFAELGKGKIAKPLLPARAIHMSRNKPNQYVVILCVLYMEEVENYVIRGGWPQGPTIRERIRLKEGLWWVK